MGTSIVFISIPIIQFVKWRKIMVTYNDFEKFLAYYCAPSLMGLKPGNLLSCQVEDDLLNQWIQIFHLTLSTDPIRIRILYQQKRKKTLYIYNTPFLGKILSKPEIQIFLKEYNYPCNENIDEMISFLSERVKESREYPHEIGIFLGYPLDDVTGFIKNHGKNYKLCGYWKVYANEDKILPLFDLYSKSRIYLYDRISQGATLKEMHIPDASQTSELHRSMLE